ncbi:hypothetical protein HRH59_12140 [Rheinheimera sp. YQF-2]|uniref:Uncharacterized protein n=1 Tax=Rheinheimera lutimaris TaxID=2740584 RepID=A0A7Y5AS57_9GAMM|nr:hypothetical protein [Rheinheimera lutimaris]NRQ43294.1 hypothetical protein [Rheinheimera lutimaris]
MELKSIFKVSAVALALVLVGCGGDINITPTVNDNSTVTNPPTNGGDNGGDENPCGSYESGSDTVQGTFDSSNNICSYTANFVSAAKPLTTDVTLEADIVHYFSSTLSVGQDCNTTQGCTIEADGPTLTVEAGATVVFDNPASRVQINRGANIEAVGTLAKPITFTSANTIEALDSVGAGPSPQDWGGVIINGFGITDQCSDAERAAGSCNAESEGASSFYGGNNNEDDSGTLRFVKIDYAGGLPAGADVGNDLNSLFLNSVGSGTEIDYISIYAGYDDGVELFGGAVNLKHVVVTDTQDDSLDIDAGWQGKVQYLLIKHGTVVNAAGETLNMGNGGFEADGRKGSSTAEAPASAPHIANVTVITTDELSARDGDPSIAMKLDDFINATFYNMVLKQTSGTQSWCVNYSGDAADEIVTDRTAVKTSVAACALLAEVGKEAVATASGSTTVTGWFTNDGVSEVVNGSDTVLANNGFSTSADVTITPTDMTTVDSFFEATDFIGAVSPSDTSSDWYKWAKAAFDNANDE